MSSKYWYKSTTIECPQCGRIKTYRERQHSPKPQAIEERYFYQQAYDYCDAVMENPNV